MSVTQERWNFSFCGPQNVNSEADEKRRGQMIISDFAKVASLWSNHLKMTHINIHSSMKSMKYVIRLSTIYRTDFFSITGHWFG